MFNKVKLYKSSLMFSSHFHIKTANAYLECAWSEKWGPERSDGFPPRRIAKEDWMFLDVSLSGRSLPPFS